MSFMRDIEKRLRDTDPIRDESPHDIEDDIPFWEFLDIEYDRRSRIFYFTAHYTQKPSFPQLFKRLIGSPMIRKIDAELEDKDTFRIYMQDWKRKEDLDSEIEVENVLYTLIDTKNKHIYVGQASKLVERLNRKHDSIPDWDYYRYDVLPSAITKNQRIWFERMLIRDFASLFLSNAKIDCLNVSKFKLTNEKIDT